MVISLIRNNVRSRIQDILPIGEIPYGEKSCGRKSPWGIFMFIMFIKCKNNCWKYSKPVFRFIFEFKNMFKQNKLFFFFYYFLFTAGFFPHGENTLWGFTPMGYVKLLKITRKTFKSTYLEETQSSLSLINGKERFWILLKNPMGIFVKNFPMGRKPHGENMIFELDGWNQLLMYFDRYSFQFCEKNRILFIFFSPWGIFPWKI